MNAGQFINVFVACILLISCAAHQSRVNALPTMDLSTNNNVIGPNSDDVDTNNRLSVVGTHDNDESSNIADTLPLNNFAMVMGHDCATGYLDGGITHPVNNWAKTQGAAGNHDAEAGFAPQLDCGSRAFDIRALEKNGQLIMHHGSVEVNHSLADGLKEIIAWLSQHPSELVVAFVADCDGTSCWDAVSSTLQSLNLTLASCPAIATVTVAQAKQSFALAQGGAMIVTNNCVQENYDPTIECYEGDDWCYGYGKDKPLNQLWRYTNSTSSNPPPQSFWMTQVHWQYSTTSIALGQLHFSSILDDEMQSSVNSQFVSLFHQGWFGPYFNFVELDYVCDHGLDVQSALTSRNNKVALALAAEQSR
eukprot:c8716_g1_i1.p1 GENE.c8716_g1_i1~~c8716_g1_i1.p1  ORF type:complete len:363 (-),score=107.27 c8716_g1_i1:238-1326(-)